jgi:hypothetical protein
VSQGILPDEDNRAGWPRVCDDGATSQRSLDRTVEHWRAFASKIDRLMHAAVENPHESE